MIRRRAKHHNFKTTIKDYVTRNFDIGDSVKIALKNGTVIENQNSTPTYVLRNPKMYMKTYSQAQKLNTMSLELNIVDFKDKSQEDFLMLTYGSDSSFGISLNDILPIMLIKVSYDTIDKIDHQEKSPPIKLESYL